MRDQERHRTLMARLDVGELDINAIDARDELRQRIQFRLGLPPIIRRAPVTDEFLDLGQLHAWLWSATSSGSGQRVAAIRLRRSSSAA